MFVNVNFPVNAVICTQSCFGKFSFGTRHTSQQINYKGACYGDKGFTTHSLSSLKFLKTVKTWIVCSGSYDNIEFKSSDNGWTGIPVKYYEVN